MNYFHMSYDEVLKSPFQRLLLLSKSIPKYEPEAKKEEKSFSIFDFAQQNNLIRD